MTPQTPISMLRAIDLPVDIKRRTTVLVCGQTFAAWKAGDCVYRYNLLTSEITSETSDLIRGASNAAFIIGDDLWLYVHYPAEWHGWRCIRLRDEDEHSFWIQEWYPPTECDCCKNITYSTASEPDCAWFLRFGTSDPHYYRITEEGVACIAEPSHCADRTARTLSAIEVCDGPVPPLVEGPVQLPLLLSRFSYCSATVTPSGQLLFLYGSRLWLLDDAVEPANPSAEP